MMAAQTPETPLISVIMANYNCETYLAGAIRSVLDQTFRSLELILVDDGSSDNSVRIAEHFAREDQRVRVHSGIRFGGPAPVRNYALDHARGEWIAIVDSDDLIHPERLERMLTAAIEHKAEILIDDLVIFQNDGSRGITTMFEGLLQHRPTLIRECDYIRANKLYSRGSQLGYAKPLIRRSALDKHGIRYNETMRIGEDYDLIVRLLSADCRMYTLPETMYYYRKHDHSISHRLDSQALDILKRTAERALGSPTPHAEVTAAHASRLKSIRRAIAFDTILRSLKKWDVPQAIRAMTEEPSAIPLLWLPLKTRLKKLIRLPFGHFNSELEADLAELRNHCGA